MYHKKSHIHFVGIGGIGMSGIAKILKHQGYIISGCDVDIEQKNIKELLNIGCQITLGHGSELCHDTSIDVLVYSSAIKSSSPEILAAQQRGIPTIPRAMMLAELMRTKYSIAITGAHGKTTTTSLISHILIEAKLDPTIIIGGHLKNISENAKLGKGDFLVAETDESDRSLLHLYPTLAVLTNIDLEHLETYKDLDDIKNTFKQFLNNIPFYGKAFVCIDDLEIQSILPIPHIKIVKFGIDCQADIQAKNIELHPSYSLYDVFQNDKLLGKIQINMPGKHNIYNSLAAIALCLDLGVVSFETICEALKTFTGVERRFSYHGTFKGAEIFDDYGHHPNEILNILRVAKHRTKQKFHVVFQPHRFIRTEKLWNNFIDVFTQFNDQIEHLIITDIYPAGEQPIEGINSQRLVEALKLKNPNFKITYVPIDQEFKDIILQLDSTLMEDDLLLLLGAGRVNGIAAKLIQ